MRNPDKINRRFCRGRASDSVIQYGYDSRGLLTSSKNPVNNTTQFQYDTAGNLLKVTDPLGHSAVYTRNAAGNVTSIKDPNGNTTTFTYDLMNRKQTQTDPYGNTTTYAWVCSGTSASGCGCCSGDAAKLTSGSGFSVARPKEL